MIKVKQHQENQFIFELESESGHTLFNSIPFSNKKTAEETVKSLESFVKKASNFERKTNHEGQFLFNFKNTEGAVLGSSQLYNSEAGMENGIKNLTNRIITLSKIEKL